VTIRDGLVFPNYFTAWQDGRPLDPDAPGYAKTLLDQLAWWAGALAQCNNAGRKMGGVFWIYWGAGRRGQRRPG
jgi:hypothetical protein